MQLLRTKPVVRFGSKHLLCQALLPALESKVKGNLTSFSPQKLLQYRLLGILYSEFFRENLHKINKCGPPNN